MVLSTTSLVKIINRSCENPSKTWQEPGKKQKPLIMFSR